LNEEKSLGFFLSSGIDQGLSGLSGACGNIQPMDLLFGAGDEGGLGGGEKAFCGVGWRRKKKSAGEQRAEQRKKGRAVIF
jgi:hypothetical protein